MSTESTTDRVLRDVLNSETLSPYLGPDAFLNAKRWSFLAAALAVLEEREMLADPAQQPPMADATPAPLDPAKVKAGDTVTIEVEIADWEDFRPGDVVVQNPEADHVNGAAFIVRREAPAPEPEPVWEPGTLAIVTPSMWGGIVNRALRGTDGGWYTVAGGHWDDDEVADVHPLVVIDPAAVDVEALVEVAHHDRVLYGDTTPDQMRRAILRILAHLGIEATS